MLNENEFKEWLEHPATKEVRRWLDARKAQLHKDWENGAFTTADFQSTTLLNAKHIGMCQAFTDARELDYETLIGDLNGE